MNVRVKGSFNILVINYRSVYFFLVSSRSERFIDLLHVFPRNGLGNDVSMAGTDLKNKVGHSLLRIVNVCLFCCCFLPDIGICTFFVSSLLWTLVSAVWSLVVG